jgi:ABC-type multidrug transport system ATPase subunit
LDLTLDRIELATPDGAPLLVAASAAFGPGVTALTGRNGAGKSTLLRAVFGLHPLAGGTVRFGPYDHVRDRAAFLERAAFMPQNFTAYPELTGREFLVYFLRLRAVARREADERAREWLGAVGLGKAGEMRTGTYSQGMLQRLGFAYAMQTGAPLCVMDEPFAGVDPDARAALTDLLFDGMEGRTVLLTTHHVEEMTERGASVARVSGGSVTTLEPALR